MLTDNCIKTIMINIPYNINYKFFIDPLKGSLLFPFKGSLLLLFVKKVHFDKSV